MRRRRKKVSSWLPVLLEEDRKGDLWARVFDDGARHICDVVGTSGDVVEVLKGLGLLERGFYLGLDELSQVQASSPVPEHLAASCKEPPRIHTKPIGDPNDHGSLHSFRTGFAHDRGDLPR